MNTVRCAGMESPELERNEVEVEVIRRCMMDSNISAKARESALNMCCQDRPWNVAWNPAYIQANGIGRQHYHHAGFHRMECGNKRAREFTPHPIRRYAKMLRSSPKLLSNWSLPTRVIYTNQIQVIRHIDLHHHGMDHKGVLR